METFLIPISQMHFLEESVFGFAMFTALHFGTFTLFLFLSVQLKWMDAAALDKAARRPQRQHDIEKIHQINT